MFRIPSELDLTYHPSGDKDGERVALTTAIAAAGDAISRLADTVAGDAAEILEFQVAMLEDEVLSAPALERISAGADAASAWRDGIAAQIGEYEATEDDYFRARAADLVDIRDRVLRCLCNSGNDAIPAGAILIGEELTPSRFLQIDWGAGGALATAGGSPSSHVAMLARSRGVPMVVGTGPLEATDGDMAIVDGDRGQVVINPTDLDWADHKTARAEAAERRSREAAAATALAQTRNGERVRVMINVAEPEELATLDPAICDGIGLVRTEFLFQRPGGLPDEETQVRAYRQIVDWAGDRPVVVRTLDAGGDKPVEGLTIDGESNPFLGTRGIRLSLARPDVFTVQLRALARVAVHGNVRVMLPMVTIPDEIDRAAALLDEAVAALRAEGIPCRQPDLGIMVEVPAVAIEPALFRRAAFFSIGSNDLTQYVTASARDITEVAALNDAGHPAVLSLIRRVVEVGHALGRDVSLCGDMGGDPAHIPALMDSGIRTVSVAPPLVGRTKLAIAASAGSPI